MRSTTSAYGESGGHFAEGGHGDAAGLLGDHQGEAIGLFGDADGGTMPRAQLAREGGVGGQREEAGGGRDTVLLNDDGAIVQGQAGLEDGNQNIAGDAGFQGHAAFHEGAQADVAFQDDERADFLVGEVLHRHHDFAERFGGAEAPGQAEPVLASDARQGAADLGLEEDDDGQADVGNDEGKQGAQGLQAGPTGEGVDRDHGEDADQDVSGARPADDHERLVNHEGDQQNVQRPGQIQGRQRRDEARQFGHWWS